MLFKKVQDFPYSRMSNNNALQTFERMAEVCSKLDILEITAYLDGFVTLQKDLSELLRPKISSAITRRLAKQDPERDRLQNTFGGVVRTGMKSLNPEIVNAANEVDVVLRRNGNPTKQQMDEQTRTTAKIIRDLTADDIFPFVKQIPGAEAILMELEDLNDQFAKDYNDRIAERFGQEKGASTKLRNEVNEAATISIEVINAYAVIFRRNEEIETAIDELNKILDQARTNLNNRGKGSGGSDGSEDPDPENPPIEIRDRDNRE